jgi:hypothetical protein
VSEFAYKRDRRSIPKILDAFQSSQLSGDGTSIALQGVSLSSWLMKASTLKLLLRRNLWQEGLFYGFSGFRLD